MRDNNSLSDRIVEAILRGGICIPDEDAFLCCLIHLLPSLLGNLRVSYAAPYLKMFVRRLLSVPKLVWRKTHLNRSCRKLIADIYRRHCYLSPVLLGCTDCMSKCTHCSKDGTVHPFADSIGLRCIRGCSLNL